MSVIAWSNFVILNIASVFCWYFYILSVQPVTRSEKYGDQAWTMAKRHRLITSVLMGIISVNMILWFWFPIPELAWPVHPIWLFSILIGIILAFVFTPIVIKGAIDAGKEAMEPSQSTEMFGGIYNYIRHPQTVGEMPWFVIIALFINSLFLTIWAIIMIIIVTPIIIHYEEKDLIKRFGDKYREYQKRTGAILPRIRKKKE
ncbi:MAG: methyltransferase family protein [Candidatus Odinarchaeota archaeon]